MINIIKNIKKSVERIGCGFLYAGDGEINEMVARCTDYVKDEPVVICYLLRTNNVQQIAGSWRERVNVGLFFSKLSNFDFDGIENENILTTCKRYAFRWLNSVQNDETDFNISSVNSSERVYDVTGDLLTAYALNVTIDEVSGVTACDVEPSPLILKINKSGMYDVRGYDIVKVDIPTEKAKED